MEIAAGRLLEARAWERHRSRCHPLEHSNYRAAGSAVAALAAPHSSSMRPRRSIRVRYGPRWTGRRCTKNVCVHDHSNDHYGEYDNAYKFHHTGTSLTHPTSTSSGLFMPS